MRTLATLLMIAASQASFAADEKTTIATGDWSETVKGLRGRLVLAQGRTLGDGKTRESLVYVEIENVANTHSGEVGVYFDPDALKCDLADASGKAVPPTPVPGSGGRPGKKWVTVPYDSSIRLRANPYAFGRAEGLLIPLNTTAWHIKDSAEYHFSGTLTLTPPAGHGRADAWEGTLKLPAAMVKAPTTGRPSVTDAGSGITIAVKEDGRTIAARGRDGKALWEADVIKAAAIPFVGQPVVRELHLKGGKVTAIYAKHSFADFELTTGKFLGAGSD